MVLSLPADVILVILTHLDTKDVLQFRQSSKEFYGLSKFRGVWDSLLRRRIIEEDIPLPGLAGRSLESLDAQELENLLRRALVLRRNWHSDTPVIKRSFRLVNPDSLMVRLDVVPGRNNGRWLVCLTKVWGTSVYYRILCWDLRRATPVCVAQKTFERLGGMQMAVSKTGDERDCIAVLTPRGIEIVSLVQDAADPSKASFVISKTISVPMTSLHYFQDRRIIIMDSNQRIFLLDIDYPQVKIEFQHSRAPPIDLVLTNTFILILKSRTLELYPLLSSVAAMPRHIIIPPIFVYEWPWPVSSGVMTLRPLLRIKSMNDPITMFIRFGSFTLPWPNNSIHQYEIRPNSYFMSAELPSEMNVPYEYPPALIGTIAAPIRMEAPTDLALGAHGTAIWLDNHTEHYYQASYGQRVAGAFARLARRRPRNSDQNDDVEESRSVPFNNSASFVFAHLKEGRWSKLALDEEEGVIFIGHRAGNVDMFKYDT